MAAHTLRERYCERFNCPPQEFRERVFWQCVPPQAAGLAQLIRPMKGGLFEPDWELIEQVADSTSLEEVHAEIEAFRYHHPPTGVMRKVLRVRVSGKRLLRLGAKVLPRRPNAAARKPPGPEAGSGDGAQHYLPTAGTW